MSIIDAEGDLDIRNCLEAADAGWVVVKHDPRFTITKYSETFNRVVNAGRTTAVTSLEQVISPDAYRALSLGFKQDGKFSAKGLLVIDDTRKLPLSIKCNSIGDQIYCILTLQNDWFNYTAQITKQVKMMDRLVEGTNSALFELDLNWNFLHYTSQVSTLLPEVNSIGNLRSIITDENIITSNSRVSVHRMLNINPILAFSVCEDLETVKGKWLRIEARAFINPATNVIVSIVGTIVDVTEYRVEASQLARFVPVERAMDTILDVETACKNWIMVNRNGSGKLVGFQMKSAVSYSVAINDTLFSKAHKMISSALGADEFVGLNRDKDIFVVYVHDSTAARVIDYVKGEVKRCIAPLLNGNLSIDIASCSITSDNAEAYSKILMTRLSGE